MAMARDMSARAMHASAAHGAARPRAWAGAAGGLFLAAALAACGGATGGGTAGDRSPEAEAPGMSIAAAPRAARAEAGAGTSRTDAFRLLTQATFGPTEADIEHVMAIGAAAWIDEQLALPVRASHLARWNADNRANKDGASPATVESSFYQEAMTDDDQLRQRVTYALSQIFVVSMLDLSLSGSKSQSAASYLDTLAQNSFGTYRALLGAVAVHPAMGQYLSTMGNRKEDPAVGRIPDQNFAREVMQLFSIGLVQLDLDGTPKPGPVYTYGPSDIDGLSRVFTGFSWAGPDTSAQRFFNNPDAQAQDRLYTPMQPYAQFHSLSEKDFLGKVIPAQAVSRPDQNLDTALDTLAAQPNVAPFISRQLIQRLVTSNPSPRYVARVATVFNDDGHGVRGNLGAVVRAILLDKEARERFVFVRDTYGKVREPVLRLTAFLRAYNAQSDSGKYLIASTDDPGTELAQSPLRARSVFNFYRPGYVSPGGPAEARGMVLPEMQITNESSVAGYANFMIASVRYGVGAHGVDGRAPRCDVQPDYTAATALADDPASLVDDTLARLIGQHVDPTLKTQIVDAVTSVEVPALRPDGSNADYVAKQRQNRVYAAVVLTLASPEFVVQR
jgi:uncharacterized protein (DUF1800 family)